MLVLCGKSASGKDTIAKEMEKKGFKKVVCYTTRPIREGERDGYDYHYVDETEFKYMESLGAFIEVSDYFTVDGRCYYGTPKSAFDNPRSKDFIILPPQVIDKLTALDIQMFVVMIYANAAAIKSRLKRRGDKKEEIARRMKFDTKDFIDMTLKANKIVYNNGTLPPDEVADQIIDMVDKYRTIKYER